MESELSSLTFWPEVGNALVSGGADDVLQIGVAQTLVCLQWFTRQTEVCATFAPETNALLR